MTQLADPPAGADETLTAAVENIALGARPLTMVQALNRALHDAMAADDRVLCSAKTSRSRAGCSG